MYCKLACNVHYIYSEVRCGAQCPVDIGYARTEVKRRPATTDSRTTEIFDFVVVLYAEQMKRSGIEVRCAN